MTKVFDNIAKVILLISLTLMLSLSTLSIGLRWFGASMLWIDPLVRHLVIVTAFAGGILAIGKNSHIRIDVLAKPMEKAPKYFQKSIERIIQIVTAMVTAALTWSAWEFYLSEKEFGSIVILGFHSSSLVSIFAIGWFAMTLRWLVAFIDSWKKAQ
ncbi:MAG: TRAP transporter small permease [Bacteriovoracaceae bacterium]|nr:TRAP transporter small permease [Bacteriovoracaceae bacterium]